MGNHCCGTAKSVKITQKTGDDQPQTIVDNRDNQPAAGDSETIEQPPVIDDQGAVEAEEDPEAIDPISGSIVVVEEHDPAVAQENEDTVDPASAVSDDPVSIETESQEMVELRQALASAMAMNSHLNAQIINLKQDKKERNKSMNHLEKIISDLRKKKAAKVAELQQQHNQQQVELMTAYEAKMAEMQREHNKIRGRLGNIIGEERKNR